MDIENVIPLNLEIHERQYLFIELLDIREKMTKI